MLTAIPGSPLERDPARRAPHLTAILTLGLVLLVVSVIGGAFLFYSTGVSELHEHVGQQLSAIADLKVGDLEQYRTERLADGNELSVNATFAGLVRSATASTPHADAEAQLRAWLASLVLDDGFELAHVLDPGGGTLLSVPADAPPVSSTVAQGVADVLRTRHVTFQDFYRSDQDGQVHLAVLVPLYDQPDGQPLGVIELGLNPARSLDSFLQTWPIPSATGETLLVRRDGTDALYLNALRFRGDGALSLRMPLSATDVPAVQAVLGATGLTAGRDYRGVPVAAAVRAVPGTPWFLVAKIDVAEEDAPLQGRLWLTLLLVVALVGSVVGGIAAFLRWYEARRLRDGLKAERAQAWLHEVIARSRNEVYVFDPGTLHFRFANQGACRNVGYTQAELTSRTPLDLMPHLTDEAFGDLLASLRAGDGPVVEFETTHRRQDGTEYPVEVHLQLVDTGEGQLALSIVDDITERRGLEAERERLLAAIEQSADAILVLDAATTIRYANQAALAISGYQRDELYGAKADFLAGPNAADQGPDGWRAMVARGGSGSLAVHAKDGRVVEAEWTFAQVRDLAGALAGYVAIARDRSKERALEAQVARIQKMEAIGQLGAGIAHDFNNILTTAGGFAQLVRDQVAEGDPMREDLDQIVAATERGATLVRQILAFSRRQVLEPGVVDLDSLVEGLGPMLRRLLGEDVELTLALDPELGHLKADPGQIEQVIINLAVNAGDAMPDGGKLSIKTANVELDDAYAASHPDVIPGPYVLLAVTDTGAGMDAATLEHMFEPFFTTKAHDRGTGLGLATVHGIVNQSGGHVWAYSEPGHGACFKVYFPRVDEHAAPYVAPPPGGVATRGSETIWLVEDDEAVRVVASRALERLGYRVVAMASPADALALLDGGAPPVDLLVTDVILPGMEGPELVRRLGERIPCLRVLFVSGYAEQRFIIAGLDGPGRAFLPKPYSLEELAREIRTLLDPVAG